ncbi:MAG: tyrosine-type recombinase/integrase [Methylobacterium sp.]|uniref:tyrosine-type recombinase/integrase n=1 Tax=Methylobacterium sp. TaxID=409 RepID=UPI0025D32EA1|nr:site-specific integrase [Methylobacterium sp.]MBX9933456.1 tyrosine-type recombinase/integrase [Methylobacterium sp.]
MATKLTLHAVKAAKPRERRYTIWDSELKGFGLRVNADGSKSYALKYLFHGHQRWHTIGKHGSPWTPDTARNEALRLLAQARNGIDPEEAKRAKASAELTVADLCDLYIEAAYAGQVLTKFDEPKKASTLATDESRILRHIKPLLGDRRIRDVTTDDIEAFLHNVAAGKTAVNVKTGRHGRAIVEGGRGSATRTVGLLGGIFAFAIRKRLRIDNPVRGVQRFKDGRNERYLSGAEMARLGTVLKASDEAWAAFEKEQVAWSHVGRRRQAPTPPHEAENRVATDAIRLLLLTGMRKSEVLQLQWRHVDADNGYLRLPTSKTGAKAVPIGTAALTFLLSLPRLAGNPYVFPGSVNGRHFVGLPKAWERIRARAELTDVRLHDLRHSFGATSASSGNSLPLLGAILGHRDPNTTQRYAHIARDPVRTAANQIAELIATSLDAGITPTDRASNAPPAQSKRVRSKRSPAVASSPLAKR